MLLQVLVCNTGFLLLLDGTRVQGVLRRQDIICCELHTLSMGTVPALITSTVMSCKGSHIFHSAVAGKCSPQKRPRSRLRLVFPFSRACFHIALRFLSVCVWDIPGPDRLSRNRSWENCCTHDVSVTGGRVSALFNSGLILHILFCSNCLFASNLGGKKNPSFRIFTFFGLVFL